MWGIGVPGVEWECGVGWGRWVGYRGWGGLWGVLGRGAWVWGSQHSLGAVGCITFGFWVQRVLHAGRSAKQHLLHAAGLQSIRLCMQQALHALGLHAAGLQSIRLCMRWVCMHWVCRASGCARIGFCTHGFARSSWCSPISPPLISTSTPPPNCHPLPPSSSTR